MSTPSGQPDDGLSPALRAQLLGGTADVGTRGRSGGTLADRAGGHLLRAVAPTAVLIALMWIAWLVLLVGGRLIIPGAGLIPRHLAGLDGVLFSPLLHGGWRHLIGNTTALLVLGPVSGLVSRRPVALLAAAWLGSGLVTWLIGTPGVHIGASGIVYALIAFLLIYGIVARRVLAIVVSLVVAVTHLGSSLLGLLPAPGISWTGHLAGAIVGTLMALAWGRQDRAARALERV